MLRGENCRQNIFLKAIYLVSYDQSQRLGLHSFHLSIRSSVCLLNQIFHSFFHLVAKHLLVVLGTIFCLKLQMKVEILYSMIHDCFSTSNNFPLSITSRQFFLSANEINIAICLADSLVEVTSHFPYTYSAL